MKRRTLIITIVAIIIAIPILWLGFSMVRNAIAGSNWLDSPRPSGEMIELDDTSLYARIRGTGKPVVIIQAGLGSTSLEWWHVQDRLAEHTTVVAYDRAGYGWSRDTNTPRDAVHITRHLVELLAKKDIDGPFILVGHDTGALYSQHFARKYPEKTAGMVLVNPVTTDYYLLKKELPRVFYQNLIRRTPKLRIAGMAADLGIIRSLRVLVNENIPDAVLEDVISHYSRADMYDAMLEEYGSHLDTSIKQASEAGPFPRIPLLVLRYSEKQYRNRLFKFQMSWDEAQMVNWVYHTIFKKASRLSPAGNMLESEKGLHYLHLDDPELVSRGILEQVRRSR